MLPYIVRRVLGMVPLLLGASLLIFVIGRLAPGDPAEIMIGQNSNDRAVVAEIHHQLGLDKPLWQQYAAFLAGAARLDFGQSYVSQGQSVGDVIRGPAVISLELGTVATLAAFAVGVPLGIGSAVRRNGLLDVVARLLVAIGVALPPFVLAAVLILVLALQLHLVPVAGFSQPSNYVMPVIVLAVRPAAYFCRITRTSLLAALSQDYIRTARGKGLAAPQVILRHALRNAAVNIVTIVGLAFGFAITGSFVVETIYNVPGIGRTAITAVLQRDYPVIQATVLLFTLAFLVVNLLSDVSYVALNPRIRY